MKTPRGVPEGSLCIDLSMTREVHQGEKHVAQLPAKGGTGRLGSGEFADFFPNLCRNAFLWVGPVETRAGGPLLQVLGVEQRGKAQRNAVETAFAGGFFLLFQLVPAPKHLGRIPQLFLAEDMGMPPDQLVGQLLGHGREIKGPPFPGQLGMEEDMEEHVPELLLEGMIVPLINGLEQLVDLLENHRLERAVGLFSVPRAATRAAQLGHDPGERLGFAHASALRGPRRFVEPERDE